MAYSKLSSPMADLPKMGGLNGNQPSAIPGDPGRDASPGSIPLRTYIDYGKREPAELETTFGTGITGVGRKGISGDQPNSATAKPQPFSGDQPNLK